MGETFFIEKKVENSNVNRADHEGLPDIPARGRLWLFRASPFSATLQLRSATDRVVQIRSMRLTKAECMELAAALLEVATELQIET